ncbi:pyridoxal phosphate biosynthesis protein [Sphaerochaeta pleomorpha str. Grapes]|uniref:Pyridoxal phosphate biosynthesis protein n=1 Tax=Sphaerochaeta pleomorpha (strain ATCC BAA-1885 / DSM 22778 / Grapes) TaxID=158190 RepID=G8QQE9_SPHPG|nr:4-hydroxythreonine-4-phosphate dehydrogenase PdxA [Sphaerochaeta pleomorpha]AEV29794.1 pyridoxal phosphate biosynthesis protein [Sphaerochaeta pleomorpha str. Grapes]
MNEKPVMGILLGDAAGVGPEIVAKLAVENFFTAYCNPIIIGDVRILNRAFSYIGSYTDIQVVESVDAIDWDKGLPVLDQKNIDPALVPVGQLNKIAGKACLEMLEKAVDLYKNKKIEGFCFTPLNKAGMKEAGCKFESEHHYMADLFQFTEPFGEINVVGNLWTTRTTSHIPISEVSRNLTKESILRAVRLANSSLKTSGIEKPRLALAALNPHCGESGLCGREEIDVIQPAIQDAQALGIDATGPYPSDITFIKAFRGDFDGVVTMYHDQGQIALKLKGFDEGITIAGGLPAPIVTCAHGTAYDIAGKGIVKTQAFENAVKMASKMANHLSGRK